MHRCDKCGTTWNLSACVVAGGLMRLLLCGRCYADLNAILIAQPEAFEAEAAAADVMSTTVQVRQGIAGGAEWKAAAEASRPLLLPIVALTRTWLGWDTPADEQEKDRAL